MKLYSIDKSMLSCYILLQISIKTLTQINLNYKQLFNRSQKQKLQKVGYKHSKTCQFTYLLYLPMQQIRLTEPLVPRACITGMSPVSLSNIGSLFIAKDTNNIYLMQSGMVWKQLVRNICSMQIFLILPRLPGN